jgi:ATP synthase protein I
MSDGLNKAVREERQRQERSKAESHRSIGQDLAMIGVLGWTVVTPTLLGVFAGRWLDRTLAFQSPIFWTLGLMIGGLVLGCWLAWKRMHRP